MKVSLKQLIQSDDKTKGRKPRLSFREENSRKLASSFSRWADGSSRATVDPLTPPDVGFGGIPWDAGDDSNELEPATGVELQSCDN